MRVLVGLLLVCSHVMGIQVHYELASIVAEPRSPLALGSTVELHCSANSSSLRHSASLLWFEGAAPIAGSDRRLLAETQCGVTLTIVNFSAVDYGRYSCRCVNNYTQTELDAVVQAGDTVEAFCSHPAAGELDLLPENYTGNISEEMSLEDAGQLNCSGDWSSVDRSGSVHHFNSSIGLMEDADSLKLVCYDRETDQVENIVYVPAADFSLLPPHFIYPANGSTLYPYSYPYSTVDGELRNTFNLCLISPGLNVSPRINILKGQVSNPDSISIPPGSIFPQISVSFERDISENRFVAIRITSRGQQALHRNLIPRDDVELVREQIEGWYRCEASDGVRNFSASFYLNLTTLDLPTLQSQSTEQECPPPSPPFTETTSLLPSPSSANPLTPSPTVSTTSLSPSPSESHDMLLPSSPGASPTPPSSSSSSPVVQGIAITAVLSVLCLVCLVLLAAMVMRQRRRANRPRKARRMSKIIGGGASLRSNAHYSPEESNPDRLCFVNPSHFSIYGVPAVSRQMATCLQELQTSQWHFPYQKLEILEDLGSGSFGVVKKALAHSGDSGAGDATTTIVAVKMLKDLSTEEDERDIISELRVLQRVGSHPNVVSLLGASEHNNKLHIIVEFCARGSLLSFLRAKRLDTVSPLSSHQLAGMAVQVAMGMEYLGLKNCIHRDLAARNVLVSENLELKIADFGLARKLYESVYRPSGGKIPVKWMSPETILDSVYTSQSDVWSFGVLLWEMLTLGRTPYPGISAKRVIKALEQGYRLSCPDHCPQKIYAVMLHCWQMQPVSRPTFTQLVPSLTDISTSLREAMDTHYYNLPSDCFHDDDQSSLCSDCSSCHDNDTSCDYCQFSSGYSSKENDSVSGYLSRPDKQRRTRRTNHRSLGVWRLDSSDSGVAIPVSEYHMTDSEDQVILSPVSAVTDLDSLMKHKSLASTVNHDAPSELQSPYLQLLSGSKTYLEILSEHDSKETTSEHDETEAERQSHNSMEDIESHPPRYDKLKVRALPSTDSGCIASEVSGLYDLQRPERLLSESSAHAAGDTNESEEVSSPQVKLSAHPRNRALFEQLGFRESDL